MKKVIKYLRKKAEYISIAESVTGGAIAARLVSNSHASDIFSLGFIVYSNQEKINTLGVSANIIDTYGVVSTQVAIAMAEALYQKTKAHLCISITGYAEGNDFEHEAFIGIKYHQILQSFHLVFDPRKSRKQNIKNAVDYTQNCILKVLQI